MITETTASSTVKSAERTMDVLELLAAQERPLAAMTIARRCGMPKSSTYHLLNALQARGFVTHRPVERGWAIGDRVRELGAGAATIPDAVAVLDAFGGAPDGLDVAELARRSRRHVTAVARIVALLAGEGLVTAHADGTCSLGLRLATLSARLGPIEELRLAARQPLIDLRDACGETANLLVREGDRAVHLDQVESRHALRHAGGSGRAVPLDVSAAGAVLTGAGSARVVLDAVEEGVTAIAHRVPVALSHPAAVSVTGPTARLRGDRLDAARAALDLAVEAIVAGMPESRR